MPLALPALVFYLSLNHTILRYFTFFPLVTLSWWEFHSPLPQSPYRGLLLKRRPRDPELTQTRFPLDFAWFPFVALSICSPYWERVAVTDIWGEMVSNPRPEGIYMVRIHSVQYTFVLLWALCLALAIKKDSFYSFPIHLTSIQHIFFEHIFFVPTCVN